MKIGKEKKKEWKRKRYIILSVTEFTRMGMYQRSHRITIRGGDFRKAVRIMEDTADVLYPKDGDMK